MKVLKSCCFLRPSLMEIAVDRRPPTVFGPKGSPHRHTRFRKLLQRFFTLSRVFTLPVDVGIWSARFPTRHPAERDAQIRSRAPRDLLKCTGRITRRTRSRVFGHITLFSYRNLYVLYLSVYPLACAPRVCRLGVSSCEYRPRSMHRTGHRRVRDPSNSEDSAGPVQRFFRCPSMSDYLGASYVTVWDSRGFPSGPDSLFVTITYARRS